MSSSVIKRLSGLLEHIDSPINERDYVCRERYNESFIDETHFQFIRSFLGKHASNTDLTDAELLTDLCKHLCHQCMNSECYACSVIVCPHGEPLHFDDDGCPSCFFE